MIFSEEIEIPSYLADYSDHLSPWGLARLLQEAAEHHCVQHGLGFEGMLKQNKSWILTQMYFNIKERPAVGDKIILSTWSRCSDGLYAYRDSQICDKEGNPMIGATAMWVLLDRTSRKVVRQRGVVELMSHDNIKATDYDRPNKLVMPAFSDADKNLSFGVQPSMLDHVLHVNNAEYVRWIDDQIGIRPIKELNIKFCNETPQNETISISRIQSDDKTFVQISNSRGVAVEAEVL